MGQLPAAMPRTMAATEKLLRSGCSAEARRRALDLLLALAAVECHASAGGPALVLPALLRDLVIVTTRLVGRAWLDANAEETASFTRLHSTLHAPPLAELDDLLACLLTDRFGLSRPRRQPGTQLTYRRPTALADHRGRPAGPGRPGGSAELHEHAPRIDRGPSGCDAVAPLDGLDPGESRRGTTRQPGADLGDVAGRPTDPALAAAVPTWISLLRRVNLGLQREVSSAGRRRPAS
jgi:hypothetical protein